MARTGQNPGLVVAPSQASAVPSMKDRVPRLSCSRLCTQCLAQVLDHRSPLMNIGQWEGPGGGWLGVPPGGPPRTLCRSMRSSLSMFCVCAGRVGGASGEDRAPA